MCLVLFQWRPHADEGSRLIVAANRDEFFHRPTAPLQRWPFHDDTLGGFDLSAPAVDGIYGTWMGITRQGRFAVLTNVRSPRERIQNAASRGRLVSDFLVGTLPPTEYLLDVQARGHRLNGFNLIVGSLGDSDPQLWWYSNRGHAAPRKLTAGVYGLSNASLDTPWPKVTRGVAALSLAIAADATADRLFDVLSDTTLATDATLPSTGVSLGWERALSPIFVQSDAYGTRSSQILRVSTHGAIDYRERSFDRPNCAPPITTTLVAQTVN